MVKVKDPCQDINKAYTIDFDRYVVEAVPGENGKKDKICKVHDTKQNGKVVAAKKLDQFFKQNGVPEGLGENIGLAVTRYVRRNIWQTYTFGPFTAKDHYGDQTVDAALVKTEKGDKKVRVAQLEKFLRIIFDDPKLSLRKGLSTKGSALDSVTDRWSIVGGGSIDKLGAYYYLDDISLEKPRFVFVDSNGQVRKSNLSELKRYMAKQGIILGKDQEKIIAAYKRLGLTNSKDRLSMQEVKNAQLALKTFNNAKRYVKNGDLAALGVCLTRLEKNPLVDADYLKKFKTVLLKDINKQKYKSEDVVAKLANRAPGLTIAQLEFQMQETLKILTVTNKRDVTTQGTLDNIYSKRLLQEAVVIRQALKSNQDPKKEMEIEGRFSALWSQARAAKINKKVGEDDFQGVVIIADQIMQGEFRKA